MQRRCCRALLLAWGINRAAALPFQTEREKANAVEMHNTFQQELMKLRLMTAKAYVKVMGDGQVSTQGRAISQFASA